MFSKCFIWHLTCHPSFYIVMEMIIFYSSSLFGWCSSCFFLFYYYLFYKFVYLFFSWYTDWFPSNEVFYQSDCELVTFDTVELFFLRKENLSIYWARWGIHLIVSVTVILNSNVVSIKMFQKRKRELFPPGDAHWCNSPGAKCQTLEGEPGFMPQWCTMLGSWADVNMIPSFSPETLPPSTPVVLLTALHLWAFSSSSFLHPLLTVWLLYLHSAHTVWILERVFSGRLSCLSSAPQVRVAQETVPPSAAWRCWSATAPCPISSACAARPAGMPPTRPEDPLPFGPGSRLLHRPPAPLASASPLSTPLSLHRPSLIPLVFLPPLPRYLLQQLSPQQLPSVRRCSPSHFP